MKLTHEQKMSMFKDGYIHVPGVIPKLMVDNAMRHINAAAGEGMDPARMPIYRAQSFFPEMMGTPPITGLFNDTPVKSLVEDLIGEGSALPVGAGQIAVRFPTLQDPPGPVHPHLDGMYSPTNGVKEGTIANFTMLVGVLLSPVRDENAGNFTVWPGTHATYESYFKEHGAESLLGGLPPVDIGKPVQTKGEPGDVFLVHYQLAHGVAPNIAPLPRYAIFFRVMHKAHRQDWKAPMTDIWLHWPGIRALQA